MQINFWAIITEKDRKSGADNLSLGRVSYWVVLIVACTMWLTSIIVPESLLIVLMALLSYNLGKKSLDAFSMWSELKNGKKEEDEEEETKSKVSP